MQWINLKNKSVKKELPGQEKVYVIHFEWRYEWYYQNNKTMCSLIDEVIKIVNMK